MATSTTTKSRAARGAAANKAEAPAEKAPKKETVQQLKNRLRNEAEREVLDAHKPEVIEKTEAKYTAHGLKYVRRLTDEEKAAKEIADNLNKYPNLRALFAGVAQDVVYADVEGNPEPGIEEYADVEPDVEEGEYNPGE